MKRPSRLFLYCSVFEAIYAVHAHGFTNPVERKTQAIKLIDRVVASVNNISNQAGSTNRGQRHPAHTQRIEIGEDGKPVPPAGFQTSGCANIPTEKWLSLLVSGEPIKHTFKFKKGCDIEGTLAMSRAASPIDLDVRNLPGVSHLKALVEPQIEMLWSKRLISITLVAPHAEFLQKTASVMKFKATYKVGLGLSGELEKNNGGTIYVENYDGKPLKLTHEFKIH